MSTAHDLPPSVEPALALHAVPDPTWPELDPDVVRRVRPRLLRWAVRRLGDAHEAEELVQEALLRAHGHRDQLRTEDDLAAWTTVVTGRLIIDRLRVRGRSTPVAEVPEGPRSGRDTADIVVARDEARTALDALDAMPTRQASVLWAREVEGLGYSEIGARFGMTEPAVRSILTRARKALRVEYASRGGTLPVGGLVVLAPWLSGLGRADRLRRTASRLVAPAALSVAGLTALGALTLSPLHPSTAGSHPGSTVPDVVTALSSSPVRVAVARPAAPAVVRTPRTATPVHPSVSRAVAPVHAATSLHGLDAIGCSSRTGVYGSACRRSHGWTLVVGPQLPANPTGVRYLGVQEDSRDCTTLPTTPLTRCEPTTGATR